MKIYFVFLRYSSVSLLTALIDYVVFAVAFLGSRRILLSMLLARSMAATFQFLMSYSFVFKAKQDKWLSIIKYLIVLGALTATAFSAIRACDEWLGVSPLISKVFIEGTIFIVSFLLLRDFVFAPADSD
jgi:putative flippase GtrA